MSREDFLAEINARQNIEIIDGIKVIHTGKRKAFHQGYGENGEDLGYKGDEILEIYDGNDNKFYSNCSSIEEAEALINKLKAKGKEAIIGVKAPFQENPEDKVGVYIIKQRDSRNLGDEVSR